MKLARIFITAALAASVSACDAIGDAWFGEEEGPPLPGERFSVLELDAELRPDPAAQGIAATLPPAQRNAQWAQPGGNTRHRNGHLALTVPFTRQWTTSVGEGADNRQRLTTSPIVADGVLYSVDSAGALSAIDTTGGARLWRVPVVSPEEDSVPLGGGVAWDAGLLFVTTGFGEVLALDPQDGGLVWRSQLGAPIRAAPTVANGRVYVVTVDNQTQALDAGDGALLWSHSGILETAGLLGGASPAVAPGIVLTPYTSGEVYALGPDTGRPYWTESLAALQRVGALASLADIRALPIIDSDLAVVTSHSGRVVGIDVRTGFRVWEEQAGGINTPWVAGNVIYLVSNEQQVVALTRDAGQVIWVTSLDRYRNPVDRLGAIVWSGPVLAGEHLIVVSSEGDGVLLSPRDGMEVGRFALQAGAGTPPIIADGTMYILTDDGNVTAYR